MVAIYTGMFLFPDFLFDHSIKYKNFEIFSNQQIDERIYKILDEAENNISDSEIYGKELRQKIYFCDNHLLYTLFALNSNKAFACNTPSTGNIFVASSNINKNEAYRNDDSVKYTRQLSQLITHETTHTLIVKKLGYWKSKILSSWKKEGFCEYVSYNTKNGIKEAKEFLIANKNDGRIGTNYIRYKFAVTYLMENEKMTFDDVIRTDLTLEQVLNKIEQSEETEN